MLANGSGSGLLRVRGDTGQMELGPGVPHPGSGQQLNITAGTGATQSTALTGVGVGTYGGAAALYLHQIAGIGMGAQTLRNQIVFGADGQQNIYAIGTDSTNTGTADWWLINSRDQHQVMVANANDSLSINYGATINGTTTVNGTTALLGAATTVANTLQHTGNQLGFYNSAPITQ